MPRDRTNKISCSSFTNEVEVTIEILRGKWKVLILLTLHDNKVIHYNEFRKLIPQITQKMLSQQLKDLEENGLVLRTVFPSTPPMVEYSLTKVGESLIPVLEEMGSWGKKYIEFFSTYNIK